MVDIALSFAEFTSDTADVFAEATSPVALFLAVVISPKTSVFLVLIDVIASDKAPLITSAFFDERYRQQYIITR